MVLSSSNIKKIPYILSKESFPQILSKESFPYISKNGTLHFPSQTQKKLKKPTGKIFHIFPEMENFPAQIFSYIALKESCSYISRNGTF